MFSFIVKTRSRASVAPAPYTEEQSGQQTPIRCPVELFLVSNERSKIAISEKNPKSATTDYNLAPIDKKSLIKTDKQKSKNTDKKRSHRNLRRPSSFFDAARLFSRTSHKIQPCTS